MWNSSDRMPTECWQKISDSQNCKKVTTYPGRMTKGGQRNCYGTRVPRRELWKRTSSLTPRSLFTGKEISWTERQPQRLRQECSNQLVEQRERPAQMVCVTSLHSPAQDAHLLVCTGAERWSSGFGGQTWGKDWGWLCRDSLKGLECGTDCK